MRRYHEKVYIPDSDKKLLQDFTEAVRGKNWRYTRHSIENLKYRHIDTEIVLHFVKNLQLDYQGIFEYYKNEGGIYKVCYRINFTENLDIILVLDKNKTIITIYINSVGDNHNTLNKNLYVKSAKSQI